MNILIIGKFYIEGFALHIAETLTAMGHAVRRFEPGFRSGRIAGSARPTDACTAGRWLNTGRSMW